MKLVLLVCELSEHSTRLVDYSFSWTTAGAQDRKSQVSRIFGQFSWICLIRLVVVNGPGREDRGGCTGDNVCSDFPWYCKIVWNVLLENLEGGNVKPCLPGLGKLQDDRAQTAGDEQP